MRLQPHEVDAIKDAARAAFGDSVVVRLFGSRTDDSERGGDIDLHVEADPPADEWHARALFDDILFCKVEPQKVDLILTKRGGSAPRGFERIAYRDGIIL